METAKLKSIIDQAQEAVKDITDESLKKIAFQKILDTLLTPTQVPATIFQSTPQAGITQTQVTTQNLTDSISEFVHSKNQKSHFNIVITMAYYFHFKGEGNFNVEELLESYGKCLIPKPKNATDIINQNIRKGLIIKVDKQKNGKQAYNITKQGIDYVNNNFTGKPKSSYTAKKKTKGDKSDSNGKNKE